MRTAIFTRPSIFVLLIAIAALLIPVWIVEYNVLHYTHGVMAYPLDDTFIHLAIGKNLALFHTWGVNAGQFASASSSLLYPLILAAAIKIFGASMTIPLVVNILAGIALLIVLQQWLYKEGLHPAGQLFVLLLVIFFTPMPILVLSGMEHTLQLLFSFLFIWTFSDSMRKLIQSGETKWVMPWTVYLFGILTTMIRYEGMFLLGIACLILLVHKKTFLAFQLGFICFLPLFIFGVYALFHGSYFFPNSVLLKSTAPPLTAKGLFDFFTEGVFIKLAFSTIGYNGVATLRLLILLPITYLLFIDQIKAAISSRYMFIILIVAVFFHLCLASNMRYPRYEAYLVGCSVALIGLVVSKYGHDWVKGKLSPIQWLGVALCLVVAFPLVLRSRDAFLNASQSSINIYEQQYQMARFIQSNYNNTAVALNDIGAVSYLSNAKVVDLWGLANIEVARSKQDGYYVPDFLDWLTKQKNAKVAIVFDSWIGPAVTRRWQKIATWEIPNNVICADDQVSFYAIDPALRPDLERNLREYEKSLPAEVVVNYY